LRAASVATLAHRLGEAERDDVPLLVFRVPALERTAWRDGRRAARALERAVTAAFVSAVAGVLRAEDAVAHDHGADTFVAALLAPMRDGQRELAPVDVRSALARIAAAIEGRTRLEVDAGWTRYGRRDANVDAAIAEALVRGARERERYAFFSAVGHELRTPLSSIRGYLETLRDDDVDAPTRRRFIGIAYAETLRLTRLLDGMFEISLLDLSAPTSRRSRASLATVLAGVGDACLAAAAARGVTVHLPAVGPTTLAIDGDRLMLVLINLVDNAIKYGRRGGRVDLTVREHPRAVTIDVDDDGPGIAAADRERVFVLGERAAGDDADASGSGIGLALVRLILERAGGHVELGASPRGGARFAVTIERCNADDADGVLTGTDGNERKE
jgi:signal transduction histidine kinase